ncbi:TetR/AcrR family transcriptional regulator (plasmid) [Nostoc sp. UHCC 0926]|uniref:TetR/AcrR family transcriptional regulator n=1 Tax=Nostoc sp. UHCC 0926 TaxID=3025190 RepID=UPI0023625B40|nr:TetR/AcrR family transcriptional regulator [Nostoc sp. UHCC 0926]WDD30178.1 TetR/AcrR family transcriptional regulator [Nostoc sp. UHCC 0926]
MPWEKSFDEDKALDAAMRIFWEKGYEATSIADIIAVTKASRYGLYHLFGDKRGLFLRVLDHYLETVICGYLSDLLMKDASVETIRIYFENLISMAEKPEIRFGCLICSTAIELAAKDDLIRKKVHNYFDWLTSLFERALQNSIDRKDIPACTNVRESALYLTGLTQGGAVFARSAVSSLTIAIYFRTGLQVIFLN